MSLDPPVMHDHTQYNIVVVGDSIDGLNYGDWQATLKLAFPLKKIRWLNLSVDGRKIGGSGTTMLSESAIVDAAVLPNAVNILLMGGGTNDICAMVSEGRTVTDIHNDMVTYITGRQSAGFDKIIRRFIIDRKQPACAAVAGGVFEANRTSLHTLDVAYCLANNISMCRCDIDNNIGMDGCANNALYFIQGADPIGKVHLNTTGAGILHSLFEPLLNNLLVPE
jgi:hypothetical protein